MEVGRDEHPAPARRRGSRITTAAHAIDGRWLVIGLGSRHLSTSSPPALPYRLDLSAPAASRRWVPTITKARDVREKVQ